MKFYLTVAIIALFSNEVSAIVLREEPEPEAPKQSQRTDGQLEASVDTDLEAKDKADNKKPDEKKEALPNAADHWDKFPPLMEKLDSDLERVREVSVTNQNMPAADAVEKAYAGHPYPEVAGATTGSENDNLAGELAKEVEAPVPAPAIE